MLAHMYSDNGFTEEVVFKSASMLYGNSKCNKAKCSTGERSRERSRAVNVNVQNSTLCRRVRGNRGTRWMRSCQSAKPATGRLVRIRPAVTVPMPAHIHSSTPPAVFTFSFSPTDTHKSSHTYNSGENMKGNDL